MNFVRPLAEKPARSAKRSSRGHTVRPGPDDSGAVVELRPADAPKGRFEALSADKLRGGYYTPGSLTAWMCRWAIRSSSDSVLEPSCGDGGFLGAAAARLIELGATPRIVAARLHGVELIPAEADAARRRLAPILGAAGRDVVTAGDFFDWWARRGQRRFTAVVGNPPFIRYQSFPEPARGRAMTIMQGLGLRPNKLTNVWVPFVVAAAETLETGGRMALVIPAELLQVTYAAQLRAFLTERFAHLDVVACNELFFEGVEQEVVLLLANGALPRRRPGNACRVAVTEARAIPDLLATDPVRLLAGAEEKDVRGDREKWLKYFLTGCEIGLMRELRAHPRVTELGQLAEIDVGIVTGANAFFVLRGSDVAQRGLGSVVRRIVSKSAHIRGSVLTDSDWCALAQADERVHLIDIRQDARGRIPARAAAYVAEGESAGVHEGYKCSIRTPWYHVPARWNPDAFLFRQIHDFPRFILNRAEATATDTIHRMRTRGIDPAVVVAGAFSHLTAASAEIEGRSYGGGVLELEPTEAERLLVPDAAAMSCALSLEECDTLVRGGRLSVALEENDRLVLQEALGLSATDCRILRAVWAKMQGRRFARSRSARKRTAQSLV